MGYSAWSDDHYRERANFRAETGTSAFSHHEEMERLPEERRTVHANLNPKGLKFRESRDSDEHPESLPIMVSFDVTGSMNTIPRVLQSKLGGLMTLLVQKGLVADPQVLFLAHGDATCDSVPLQVGQFESGLEMEDDLGRMYLEGGGGSGIKESYELTFYVAARHTVTDSIEKRSKKGYLFLIGDELPYNEVSRTQVKKVLGESLQTDIPLADIVAETKEKYNVFFMLPRGGNNSRNPELKRVWGQLLGEQNVLDLEKPENICETIGLTIGLMEGTVELADAAAHMVDIGTQEQAVESVTRALAPLARVGSLAKASASSALPGTSGASTRARRL
jgi:hypothetical protein